MAAKAYKEQLNNNLATRNDLETVKKDLGHEIDLIKKDVEHIKHQLNTNVATKADLAELKAELKQDISVVKTNIDLVKKDIEHIKEQMLTKSDLIKWMVPFFVATILAILSLKL